MTETILSRYLDARFLGKVAARPIEPKELVGGNLAGAHQSPFHGLAIEFAGHRDYIVGDDPRHIDWRLYYKRERLSIKQFEMETNFVCHLLLDVSGSMRYGADTEQKLTYAAKAAVTLAYAIVVQNDKVSLATFDDQVRGLIPPGNSLAQIHRMTQHLEQISPVEKTRMSECLSELASRMGRREIVMIFSDFFTDLESLESALHRMKYSHHEVVLFQILHHDERSFEFEGMFKFRGMEDQSEHLASTSDIRAAYLKALNRHETRFDEICRRNKVERVSLDTSHNLGDDLIEYLNQRTRVRVR